MMLLEGHSLYPGHEDLEQRRSDERDSVELSTTNNRGQSRTKRNAMADNKARSSHDNDTVPRLKAMEDEPAGGLT
jgi:hypothetical protein